MSIQQPRDRSVRATAACLRGDEAELFRRHGDWLVRVPRLRLQCTQELAEDAAAHAWVQLCRTQPERTEKLPGWLRVVALYEGYRLLKKVGREPLFEDACRQERESGGGGQPLPLEEIAEAPVDVELAGEGRGAPRAPARPRRRPRRGAAAPNGGG